MIQKQKTLVSCEGEKLTDSEVDQIFKLTGTEEDIEGNIKYEGPELFLCSTSTSLLASLVAICTCIYVGLGAEPRYAYSAYGVSIRHLSTDFNQIWSKYLASVEAYMHFLEICGIL